MARPGREEDGMEEEEEDGMEEEEGGETAVSDGLGADPRVEVKNA